SVIGEPWYFLARMRKFTTIEMDCLLSTPNRGGLLSFRRFRFDVIRSRVLAAEWIPDSSLRLVRNDVLFDNGSVAL
ncbi:hypothetical protein M2G58_00005, partial [Vibrio vulnificus]|nr:hypothetical protein [Vibrio vulnificus]